MLWSRFSKGEQRLSSCSENWLSPHNFLDEINSSNDRLRKTKTTHMDTGVNWAKKIYIYIYEEWGIKNRD